MLDKIANQKLFFISLIGIVVTSMILTTTFAYQSIRVNYSEGADSEVSINAGKLDVKYCRNDECVDPNESENNYNKISVDNLSFLPDYKTASYVEFVINNTNSSDDVAYMISLTDLTYNKMFVSEAFKYTVVVVNDDGTLTEIITDNFSTLTGNSFDLNLEDRIYKYIEKGKTERVRIYLWLDENIDTQLDLTDTSERSFTGVVNVSSIFEGEVPFEPVLLNNLIIKNAKKNIEGRTQYSEVPLTLPAAVASGANEMTLSATQDDYGTSYYFRGNVIDNYINFNNMCWRIVRIQGDGSVKLVLADSMNLCDGEGYSVENTSSAFVGNGYMGYSSGELYSLEEGMRVELNEWFSNNFSSIIDYVKLEDWCTAKNTHYNIAIESSYFDDYLAGPGSGYTDSYKRFTVDKTASLICEVESLAEERVGVLSVDEIMFAGAIYDENDSVSLVNYLKTNSNSNNWRVFGFMYFFQDNPTDSVVYKVSSLGNVLSDTFSSDSYYRPSIVLKDTVKVLGSGTIEEPYEVKLSE